jgi:magnesium transporter
MKDHTTTLTGLYELQPADWADRLERLPAEDAREILNGLPAPKIAAILSELPSKEAARLLEGFPEDQIVAWLQMLPSHVAADLADSFPASRRKDLLAALPPDQSAAVMALLRYPSDSAGGIMDNRFIAMRADQTVEACLTELRASPRQRTDDVLYVYVTDDARRLVGVVSLRELVFAPAERRLSEIMNQEVRFLRVTDDQEEIARQLQHYHFLGLPVVDEQERLLGVVRIRDAIRVAEIEATEDMQLMVGLSGEERIWTPWRHSISRRLPWLGVNLGTALGAATVVSFFEGTISRWTALVAFLPLICAVAGNAGNQALTVIIRSLALGEVAPGDALRALRKELFIGAVNGVVLALAIGLIAFGWKGSVLLGAVAGTAMLLNQILGALAGVAIPFGLKWCKVDPALASSIFVTALTDTMGFLVFLGLATLALRAFGL